MCYVIVISKLPQDPIIAVRGVGSLEATVRPQGGHEIEYL